MPHYASLQGRVQEASRWVLLPLYEQRQWLPLESVRIPATMTNWPVCTATFFLEPSEMIQKWQGPGVSVVSLPPAVVRCLERLYIFRDREEVLWFLERYPFLVSLLLEAYEEIWNYFPYSQVSLEVISDPEALDEYQLLASISTSLAPDEAIDKLEQFDESWWLDALDRVQSKLCIDVEFL
jgi:hypothetical protein